jgi:hypothetical protein
MRPVRTAPTTADVLDRVLDRGIVIEYFARRDLLGIDVLTTVEARFVVASIDTYLRRAGKSETRIPSPC